MGVLNPMKEQIKELRQIYKEMYEKGLLLEEGSPERETMKEKLKGLKNIIEKLEKLNK